MSGTGALATVAAGAAAFDALESAAFDALESIVAEAGEPAAGALGAAGGAPVVSAGAMGGLTLVLLSIGPDIPGDIGWLLEFGAPDDMPLPGVAWVSEDIAPLALGVEAALGSAA